VPDTGRFFRVTVVASLAKVVAATYAASVGSMIAQLPGGTTISMSV
jgi:hypothetical protein